MHDCWFHLINFYDPAGWCWYLLLYTWFCSQMEVYWTIWQLLLTVFLLVLKLLVLIFYMVSLYKWWKFLRNHRSCMLADLGSCREFSRNRGILEWWWCSVVVCWIYSDLVLAIASCWSLLWQCLLVTFVLPYQYGLSSCKIPYLIYCWCYYCMLWCWVFKTRKIVIQSDPSFLSQKDFILRR